MSGLIDGVGSKRVGVYLDIGEAVLSGAPPEMWIKELGGRIKSVRARDVTTATGTFANLLNGDMDLKLTARALAESGFSGTVVADVPGYGQYPELGLKHCAEAMRKVFRTG